MLKKIYKLLPYHALLILINLNFFAKAKIISPDAKEFSVEDCDFLVKLHSPSNKQKMICLYEIDHFNDNPTYNKKDGVRYWYKAKLYQNGTFKEGKDTLGIHYPYSYIHRLNSFYIGENYALIERDRAKLKYSYKTAIFYNIGELSQKVVICNKLNQECTVAPDDTYVTQQSIAFKTKNGIIINNCYHDSHYLGVHKPALVCEDLN